MSFFVPHSQLILNTPNDSKTLSTTQRSGYRAGGWIWKMSGKCIKAMLR